MQLQVTDKMVEKVGVQRTPGANPENYKTDDYSTHLKGENSTHGQMERVEAGGVTWFCIQCQLLLAQATIPS